MVGGRWDELGRHQFEFLRAQGLRPEHYFLDIGCGSLRGGIHAIDYLAPAHYFGIDVNRSLLKGARQELRLADLENKKPDLRVSDNFEVGIFGQQFDYVLAFSVFTHVFANQLVRCLTEVRRVLAPDGRFFATFFMAPERAHLAPITHQPGGFTTQYDRDPFHYSREEFQILADLAGLSVEFVPGLNHPCAQQMLVFT